MSITSCMSLVERKKLQWAREREELASLNHPWGVTESTCERYDSKDHMVNNQFQGRISRQSTRRSSLPPLHKNRYNNSYEKDRDLGGETSGYGSDNNKTPETSNWHQSGYESSSSRDDRPRWGDKGVGVGKFWQPKDESFEKTAAHDPPNWVKRGLKDGEIEVNNTSPAESPEQKYEDNDRPYTSSSYNSNNNRNTYIRGQNIPVDALELAERDRRRQIALAHQEAIRQQLEERERRRREERERRIKEEHEEELRIEREQELERQRREEELKQIQQKQENDRKRNEAIREAIELAQKEATLNKTRRKANNVNLARTASEADTSKLVYNNITPEVDPKTRDDKEPLEQLNNTRKTPVRTERISNEITNNLEIKGKSVVSPRSLEESSADNNQEIAPVKERNNQNYSYNQILPSSIVTPRGEKVTLVAQSPAESAQNIQYALLVPVIPQAIQNIPTIPYQIPHSARSCSTARTENRILTPTLFRNKNVMLCDIATQTEESVFSRADTASENKDKYVREKLTNLELSYENRNRKDRRSRSESLEERPKWGANRPPTRYVKQSEKDLLYQRRKIRQSVRETKSYDYKISSDDSQPGSPMSFRRKSYSEKRTSRALWRKQDDFFNRSVRMRQTEVVPLESDKGQIYYRSECCCTCRCSKHRCSEGNFKVDILSIEHVSPREKPASATRIDRLPEMRELDNHMYNTMPELHTALEDSREEPWLHSPGTPSLTSTK